MSLSGELDQVVVTLRPLVVFILLTTMSCIMLLFCFERRTKVQILKKGADMKARIKVIAHFISIMKVIMRPSSHHLYEAA